MGWNPLDAYGVRMLGNTSSKDLTDGVPSILTQPVWWDVIMSNQMQQIVDDCLVVTVDLEGGLRVTKRNPNGPEFRYKTCKVPPTDTARV